MQTTGTRAQKPERAPAWLRAAALLFLPGLLAGTQLAGLLFFLNPQVPFGPVPLLRVSLAYGVELGLISMALLLPWCWRRPGRAGRILPWAVSVVLLLAAVLDWAHAARFSFYLPPGINVRLIKAALWLSLGALICFYTALLHSLNQRRYSWRSRVGLTLVAFATVYALVARREAFQAAVAPPPRPSAVTPGGEARLFVIGIDGATLDAVLPLAEQGELPFLQQTLREGAYGRLRSLAPTRRPALWTTLATGQYPYRHRLVGETAWRLPLISRSEPVLLVPAWIGFERWGTLGGEAVARDAADNASLSGWELLARLGVPTALVGWPASAPLPSDLVFGFAERFFGGQFTPATAMPPELAERGLLFQVSVDAIDRALLRDFGTDPPERVAVALAADQWRQSLTLFLLDQRPEVEAIYLTLPGLQRIQGADWGGYEAVQFGGVSEPSAEEAANRVTAYYRRLDEFLARLWRRISGPRLLAVVSVHGVEEPPFWQQLVSAGPDAQLRGDWSAAPDGLFILRGHGVRAGATVSGAQLVDVLPTLLYALGLPLARDLDGQVQTDFFTTAFLARHPLTFVPSYETLGRQQDEIEVSEPVR